MTRSCGTRRDFSNLVASCNKASLVVEVAPVSPPFDAPSLDCESCTCPPPSEHTSISCTLMGAWLAAVTLDEDDDFEAPFPPPEPEPGSPLFLPSLVSLAGEGFPCDFNRHSVLRCSLLPQIQHRAFLSSTPSQLCDHLQFFPALQPASDRKYRHGVEVVETPALPPLPFSPVPAPEVCCFCEASNCLTLMGEGVVGGALIINDNVSASANKH